MFLSFKSVFNKEHKVEICNMTSSSNSSKFLLGKNHSYVLDFTRNYERVEFLPLLPISHYSEPLLFLDKNKCCLTCKVRRSHFLLLVKVGVNCSLSV